MKKIIALVLSMILLCSVVVCGVYAENGDNNNQNEDTETLSVAEFNFDTNTENVREFDNVDLTAFDGIDLQDMLGNNTVSPRSIIGDDDRTEVDDTTEYPYSAIVLLEVKWGLLSTSYATGFMISDNVAVTAAHALYKKDKGWPISVKVYPAKDGYGILNNPYGSSRVKKAGVCTQWQEYIDSSSEENPTYSKEDWGAVVLKESLGEETGVISIKCPTNNELLAATNDETVKVCGYYNTSEILPAYHQYEMNGNISAFTDDYIYYAIDTYDGQSGSPVLNEDNVAIGVHFGNALNDNVAVRMDENMMYYFNLAVEENR